MPLSRSRKLKRREKQRRLHRSLDGRLAAMDAVRGLDIVQARIKMSEVLIDFVDPFRQDTMSEFQLRTLIAAGIVAWNAAMLPKESREELLERAVEDVVPEVAAELREMLSEMVERKQRYFARITRFMLNYQLTMTSTGPHLDVLSTL